ncbi:MAG: hypothetical protein ACREQI_11165 [Candidatus Binataceae bacterium]
MAYWIVSPNVHAIEGEVQGWRDASIRYGAAFIGHGPNRRRKGRQDGYKFARVVRPGDVILVARRKYKMPEMVGFGVVQGNAETDVNRMKLPGSPGSLRRLKPFIVLERVGVGVPLLKVLPRNRALTQLHPDSNGDHKKLCHWLETRLGRRLFPHAGSGLDHDRSGTVIINDTPPDSSSRDYLVQTAKQVKTAKKEEARLVRQYWQWLSAEGRAWSTVLYGRLRCDTYERDRRNLIEAKSSTSREHLRIAVGQLFDYAYQGRRKLGEPHKAILVPAKPSDELIKWLRSLEIAVIWPHKKRFVDTANGQFL